MRQEELKEFGLLKQEYSRIPIPKEARERAAAGIAQAKKEREGNKIMRFAKHTGAAAAAAMAVITLLTNLNPAIAHAMEQIPVIGSIAKVVTFRTYQNRQNHFEADIQVPGVAGDGQDGSWEAANKSIEEYADELIAMYEHDLAAAGGEGNYSLDSSYRVVTDNSRYLSIRIDTTLAMASGTQYVKIFTIDKASGSVVTLSQLFQGDPERLSDVSQNIRQQMKEQMAADDGVQYFYQSDVPETDFKGLTGEESYYFTDTGELVIAFDEYQVAPGYMGAVEFIIPKTVTGEL